jgi:hypothetical protein
VTVTQSSPLVTATEPSAGDEKTLVQGTYAPVSNVPFTRRLCASFGGFGFDVALFAPSVGAPEHALAAMVTRLATHTPALVIVAPTLDIVVVHARFGGSGSDAETRVLQAFLR